MEKEDLEKVAEIVKKYDLFVLSDEIYSELTYTGDNHVTIASLPGNEGAYHFDQWIFQILCDDRMEIRLCMWTGSDH